MVFEFDAAAGDATFADDAATGVDFPSFSFAFLSDDEPEISVGEGDGDVTPF